MQGLRFNKVHSDKLIICNYNCMITLYNLYESALERFLKGVMEYVKTVSKHLR